MRNVPDLRSADTARLKGRGGGADTIRQTHQEERGMVKKSMNKAEQKSDQIKNTLTPTLPLPPGGRRKDALAGHARAVGAELARLYPDAYCALTHSNAFELVIATVLSAQCTDERVNMVTPVLFKRFPTPAALGMASQEDVEGIVKSTGFFRNKAKNIIAASKRITEVFGGKVPDTMEELLTLPGVARKTSNVVLGNAYGKNVGVVVDTHVSRLSQRMGLTKQKTPEKIELDLMKLFPQSDWTVLSHRLIFHGRQVCNARKPACERCTLAGICPKIAVDRDLESRK
jgi:endonuclease III